MPTEDEVTRKLRAILSADVKGYSLLMADDEVFTVKTLKSYRKVMSAQIVRHKGRVVDTPGDNLLSEFASVVDAVQCAVEIQKILKEKNKDLPPDKRLEFRIGVNIGDVIQDGDSIYGAGVNVAARIEGLADAGEISISRNAYDHVKDKLNYGYEYLGDHEVKNIKDPVRVYKVLMNPEDAGKLIGKKTSTFRKKWPWLAVVTVAFLIGVIVWQFYYEKSPPLEAASVENMAFPLPNKPSIAVLPFDNLNNDPEQDYLADGITDNIIAVLSYIPQMFVIARNSSFTYKGKPVKVQQVSEELGVQYILEGSVLQSGDKVRVTANLIDALSGRSIWAERYDRDIEELFALLDEITQEIVIELQVKLSHGEQARMWYKSTTNLEAWGYAVKGYGRFIHFTKEGNTKSRVLFEHALELDPDYAYALTMLAFTHFIDARFGYADSSDVSLKRAIELAKKAVVLDENDPIVHTLWEHIYLIQRQHDKAVEEGRKAIALGPNDAEAHILFGEILSSSGYFEEAVEISEKAMRLHPHTPVYYFGHMMTAYRRAGRYEESLAMAKQLIDGAKKIEYPMGVVWGYLDSAQIYIRLGQKSEAQKKAAEALKIMPWYNLEWDQNYSSAKLSIMQQESDDLRKAGIPEHEPSQ